MEDKRVLSFEELESVSGGATRDGISVYEYKQTLLEEMRVAKAQGMTFPEWYSAKVIENSQISLTRACRRYVQDNYIELNNEWKQL